MTRCGEFWVNEHIEVQAGEVHRESMEALYTPIPTLCPTHLLHWAVLSYNLHKTWVHRSSVFLSPVSCSSEFQPKEGIMGASKFVAKADRKMG